MSAQLPPRSKYFVVLTFLMLSACTSRYSYTEKGIPQTIPLSPRLHNLFTKTKLVCFGRYALEVPFEAELISGKFDSGTLAGGLDARSQRIDEDIGKIKTQKTAGISFSGAGPVESSWQLRYYNSLNAKEMGLYFFRTYVTKGEFTFILEDSLEEDSEEIALAKHAMRAKSLRERKVDEVPSDPGFCIDRGFLASESYDQQETFSAGLYLPSFPDVTFSVHSNKDAYADYSPTDFANVKLSLLDRIEEAKQEQGKNYPQRTLLREGKRKVQHWHGEESLIRRSDGAHDFEWHFVGRPKDVANPSEFSAGMFTKVKDNIVGNAPKSSLSNDEAVALFDKLLSSLKFRVVVANAPQGSYYFPSDTKLKK